MKLSLSEAILLGLWVRKGATIQQVLILKFVFWSEKFPCLSRNRPRPMLEGFIWSLWSIKVLISPPSKLLACKHFSSCSIWMC